MQRPHGDGKLRHVFRMRDTQAMLAHMFDMLGPWIDEGHVLTGLHHMRTGIAANRTRTHDRYFVAHVFSRRFASACFRWPSLAPCSKLCPPGPKYPSSHRLWR